MKTRLLKFYYLLYSFDPTNLFSYTFRVSLKQFVSAVLVTPHGVLSMNLLIVLVYLLRKFWKESKSIMAADFFMMMEIKEIV